MEIVRSRADISIVPLSLLSYTPRANYYLMIALTFDSVNLVSITGVSGSGKSTLIDELLHPALQHHLTKRVPFPKDIDELKGISAIDKVIIIVREACLRQSIPDRSHPAIESRHLYRRIRYHPRSLHPNCRS
jgi:excinuclease UvrABC ATPase subunit